MVSPKQCHDCNATESDCKQDDANRCAHGTADVLLVRVEIKILSADYGAFCHSFFDLAERTHVLWKFYLPIEHEEGKDVANQPRHLEVNSKIGTKRRKPSASVSYCQQNYIISQVPIFPKIVFVFFIGQILKKAK